MKKLVFALCMMFGAVAVNAQDSTSTTSPTDPTSTSQSAGMEDQGRVKIKSQELPDAVKSSLESQEYRGWLVNSAYRVEGTSTSGTGSESSTSESSSDASTSDASTSDTTSVSGDTQTGAYAEAAYIVELKNGAQTKTVRFDKDGKKLDDGSEMNGDQK
jgi:hypothetical protein